MALMGSWNGFQFEVSPSVVRGFTGLTIKGGSETEDKVSEKQKYVERKNSSVTEIALSVYLNAYMGCNVRDEATSFIAAAMDGVSNYFYVGGKKLVTYKLMLVQAEVTETKIAADGTWIECKIGLTMKQCEKYGKATSNSNNTNQPAKNTVKQEGIVSTVASAATGIVTSAITAAKSAVSAITDKIKGTSTEGMTGGAFSYLSKCVAEVNKTNAAGKATTQTTKQTTTVSKPGASIGAGKRQITPVAIK